MENPHFSNSTVQLKWLYSCAGSLPLLLSIFWTDFLAARSALSLALISAFEIGLESISRLKAASNLSPSTVMSSIRVF